MAAETSAISAQL